MADSKEYIEREKVHELVRSLTKYAWRSPDKSKHRTTVSIDDVQFGIDRIPAADMVEVRHGKWTKKHRGLNVIMWKCSKCGFYVYEMTYEPYEYCPHCGAKMDGKDGADNA